MVVTILTVGAEGTSHPPVVVPAGRRPAFKLSAPTVAVMCRSLSTRGELHTPCFGGMVPVAGVIIQFTIHILVSAEYSLLLLLTANKPQTGRMLVLWKIKIVQDHESKLNY